MSDAFEDLKGQVHTTEDAIDLERAEILDTEDPYLIREAANNLVYHHIIKQKIIDKNLIFKKLSDWNRQFMASKSNLEKKEIHFIINDVFSDYETFDKVKEIAQEKGRNGEQIRLAPDQYIETAEWMMSRFYIKRLSLDGAMIFFDEKCYSFKSEAFVLQQINMCLPFAETKMVSQIFKYIERNAERVDEDVLEKFSHIVCFENGMYDIKEGKFYGIFNPEFIVMHLIPHNFIEVGDCQSGALQIIKDIVNNPEDFSVFQDFLSTCLYPDIGLDFMIIFLGGGGTGKKQIATFAKDLLGRENVTNFSIHGIVSDTTNQIEAARSMLNIDEDMGEGAVEEITVILKWVTRDPFSGRGIYQLPINYTPLSRLMANTNRLFDVSEDAHAEPLYDRCHTILLKKKFRKSEEEVSNIVKKTFTELDYDKLITATVKNATELYQSQVVKYRHSTLEEEDIWNEFGNWILKFYQGRILSDKHVKEAARPIWESWLNYAEDNDLPRGGRNKFYRKFEDVAKVSMENVRIGDNRRDGFYGVRLLTPKEIEEREQSSLKDHE